LTKNEFKQAVRSLPGITRDNLDTLLMHPDAEDALLLDPVTQLIRGDRLASFWPTLSPRVQKRARDAWQRGKALSLADLRTISEKLHEPVTAFDAAILTRLDVANTRKRKKDAGLTHESLLAEKHSVKKLIGRATYARPLLARAYAEVMAGMHPKEVGGCLYLDEAKRHQQLQRRIEDQTNNHLVRHRLLILERLLRDLIADPQFAAGDKSRICSLTIEVNRDLREMSGKTAKQIEQDLGLRLSNHGKVTEDLEAAFAEQSFNGQKIEITAGLIRKARVAHDLDWVCPYTGKEYEPIHLVSRQVDKDHIIPRSQRPSDSLDSLIITFAEINRWKGNRTAWQFIQDEQGKPVPGLPQLSIRTLAQYETWVKGLETFKGHPDDKRRKKNRRALLLLPRYEDKSKTFLPGDLTQTSQLVRLGAQLLTKTFIDQKEPPTVVSIPGAVTATVRRSWDLLGCLSLAAPQILDDAGACKNKTEIRDITHLHHALDACVLTYTSLLLPRDGGLWQLMIKRNPNEAERAALVATGCFDFDQEGRFGLRDLPPDWKNQLRARLAEKRVVQHVPADMGGLRVEENTRGVEKIEDGRVYLHQRSRDAKTGQIKIKSSDESIDKVVGLSPANGTGKLKPLKGVRVITDNFGIALLDHAAEGEEKIVLIPWHKIWHRLSELRPRNAGKKPRLLRNGMRINVPTGTWAGTWRVKSTKKTEAYGYSLDLAAPDGLKLVKGNAPIEKLLKAGFSILHSSLSG
jgi:CRISPR-associated endonuclease Csn1